MKRQIAGTALRALSLLFLAGCANAVWAQTAPANDTWTNAIQINNPAAPVALTPATPYSGTVANLNLATVDTTDPMIVCKNPAFASPSPVAFSAAEGQMANTVWYTYTTGAATEYVNIKATEATFTVAGGFDTVIAVYTGSPGSFRMVTGGCDDDGVPFSPNNNFSRIAGLRLQPNTTYSIEVAFNPGMIPPATSVLKLDVAAATRINVNTTTDAVPITVSGWPVPPATTGNPCLDPSITGACSLRAAIETAAILGEQTPNAAGANGAAIFVPAGTYPLSPYPSPAPTNDNKTQNVGGGDLDIWGSMGIYGAGMGQTIIVAPTNDRAFGVTSPNFNGAAAVPGITSGWQRFSRVVPILMDMTLQGPGPSVTPAPTGPTSSSGLFSGGGAFDAFERVELNGGYVIGNGGAMNVGVSSQIRDSKFINNTSMPFNANTVGSGGAVYVSGSPSFAYTEVSGSTFTGNFAAADVFSGNASGGGAILTQGELVLVNSTLSGNGTNGYGGAVLVTRLNGGEPIVDIRNSTIVDNNADANGDGIGDGGGLYADAASSLNSPAVPTASAPALPTADTISNSIIANNTVHANSTGSASNCAFTPYAVGASQVVIDTTHSLTNLAGTGTCAFAGTGNVVGPDPMLLALANNGGLTQTHALQPGSPAVDAGDPAGCKGHFGRALPFDQRGSGFGRVFGASCDMGAFELSGMANAPGVPALTPASDTGDSNSDNITTVTKPTLTGTCGTSGDTVTLAVDGGAAITLGNCSGGTYTITLNAALGQGAHTISAFESNASGPSPQSAALSVTIDLIGPVITLTATPPAWEASSSVDEFDFTVAPSRPAQCQLDGGGFSDCSTPPVDYFSLAGGQHTFTVHSTNVAGAVSSVSYTWQIGTPSAPSVVLAAASDTGASSSDGITKADPLLFQATCVTGDSIQLYQDGNAAGAAVVCAGGSASISLAGVVEGTHAMTATATRGTAASAASAAKTVIVDRTAPVLTMLGTPQANMVSASATFTFQSSDAGTPTQCQLDSGGSAACTSPQTYSGLAIGAHTFTVASTDLAGNTATPLTYTWTVIQPLASGAPMLAPASDSGRSNTDGITNAVDTVFTGACTDGDSIQLYDGASTAGNAATCASGVYNITLSNLPEGMHSIAMTATRNGIASAMSAASAISIDRTAPDAPAINGSTGPAALTATLNGLAEPNAIVVVRDGGTPVCSATTDAQANWSCTGPLAGSGTRSLTATATDVAGNTGAASPAFNVTTTGNDRIFANGFDG